LKPKVAVNRRDFIETVVTGIGVSLVAPGGVAAFAAGPVEPVRIWFWTRLQIPGCGAEPQVHHQFIFDRVTKVLLGYQRDGESCKLNPFSLEKLMIDKLIKEYEPPKMSVGVRPSGWSYES
jgi:hypothetical protein